MFDQRAQLDLGALPRSKTSVELLLLAPEFFKLLLFEFVKVSFCSFLYRLLGLFQPLGIVVTIFKVELELTDSISPMIRVAQEGFG